MSETTAVADAPEVIPTQETPPPAVEETPAIPAPEAEAAAPAAEVEITADNLDELPEWKALSKPPEEAKPAAADDLPGESLETIEARNEQIRAQRYAQIMRANDQGFRTWATQQGYSAEEAQNLWQQLSPMLRAVHSDNDAHNRALFNYSAGQVLPKEQAEVFYSRSYRSQAEALGAIHELGKKAANAEWEGKVAKGEYVPLAKVQVVRDAAFSRGRGLAEAQGGVSGSQSGASFGGSAGGTGGIRTKAQARALHVENKITSSQMRIINADPRIPEN